VSEAVPGAAKEIRPWSCVVDFAVETIERRWRGEASVGRSFVSAKRRETTERKGGDFRSEGGGANIRNI